jgi:heme exporter protein D
MVEFFQMGGWGMYPTLVFGVLALGAALRYAMTGDRARLLLAGICQPDLSPSPPPSVERFAPSRRRAGARTA